MEDSKVAVLIEDLLSQFRVFGEGQEMLTKKVDKIEEHMVELEEKITETQMELKAEIAETRKELTSRIDQLDRKVSALDKEVQFEIKRVK